MVFGGELKEIETRRKSKHGFKKCRGTCNEVKTTDNFDVSPATGRPIDYCKECSATAKKKKCYKCKTKKDKSEYDISPVTKLMYQNCKSCRSKINENLAKTERIRKKKTPEMYVCKGQRDYKKGR